MKVDRDKTKERRHRCHGEITHISGNVYIVFLSLWFENILVIYECLIRLDVEIDHQRLIFKGKQLSTENTLFDYR